MTTGLPENRTAQVLLLLELHILLTGFNVDREN
jgi:hypothetical protein